MIVVFPHSYYIKINLATIIYYRISCIPKYVISCDVQCVWHVQSHMNAVTQSDLSKTESSIGSQYVVLRYILTAKV